MRKMILLSFEELCGGDVVAIEQIFINSDEILAFSHLSGELYSKSNGCGSLLLVIDRLKQKLLKTYGIFYQHNSVWFNVCQEPYEIMQLLNS